MRSLRRCWLIYPWIPRVPLLPIFWNIVGALWLFLTSATAATPQVLAKYPSPGANPNLFYGVAITDDAIYTVTYGVSNTNGALRRLNRTSPLGETAMPVTLNGARKLRVSHGLIHVLYSYSGAGNWRWGLRIFSTVSLQEIPTNNRILSMGRRALGLDVDGDQIAYVAGEDGLTLIDVSHPEVIPTDTNSGPRVLAKCSAVLNGQDVSVFENIAFVADGLEGLKMIDVAQPALPQLVGQWRAQKSASDTSTWSVRGVTVRRQDGRRLAYLIGEGHFWIVDVSDPAAPLKQSELPEEGMRIAVAAGSGTELFAYVAGDNGLRIYDVGNLQAPTLSGRFNTGNQAEDLVYEAPFICLADRSGLYMLQHGSTPPIPVQTALRRLKVSGIANLHDQRLDDQGRVSPLVPVSDRTLLAQQDPGPPAGFKGLVADGVTPLLIQVQGKGVTRQTSIRWSAAITGGGTLAASPEAYFRVLRETNWESAETDPSRTIVLAPEEPQAYLYFTPLHSWEVNPTLPQNSTNAPAVQVTVRFYDPTTSNLLAQAPFSLRRPAVALISEFPAEPWSEEFLAEIHKTRGVDFVKTFDHAPLALAWLTNTLAVDWMVGRMDCVAHGRGALEVRWLCLQYASPYSVGDHQPYRNGQNLERGWFHRLVTIGAPHRGTTLAPYLRGLYQQVMKLADKFQYVSLLPQRLQTIPQWMGVGSESLLIGVTGDWAGYYTLDPDADYFTRIIGVSYDPAARFHLVYSTLLILGIAGEYDVPSAFQFVGLRSDHRRRQVFPMGSDGLVDLMSMVAGTTSACISPQETEISSLQNVAHGGAQNRLFGRPQSQTTATAMAQHVLAKLDSPDAALFGSFEAPLPLTEGEIRNLRYLGGEVPARLLGEILPLFLPSLHQDRSSETKVVFPSEIQPPPDAPLAGPVTWLAEVYGATAISDEGITIVPHTTNPLRVEIEIAPSVLGDVVLFASYPTREDKIVFCPPMLVLRREPANATLTGIEIQPATDTLNLHQSLTPLIVALYSNGSKYRRWLAADEFSVFSSAPDIVNVTNKWQWEGVLEGAATVTVSYAGFTAASQITVVDPYPPRTFDQWLSQYFTPAHLADPSVTGPLVDLDSDGLPLLEEYFIAGHPYQPDPDGTLRTVVGDFQGANRLVLIGRVSATLAGAQLAFERSSNLTEWTPLFSYTGASTDLNHPLIYDYIHAGSYYDLIIDLPVQRGSSNEYFRAVFQQW